MKLTTRERKLVASMMAVSNMGLEINKDHFQDMVGCYKEGYTTDDLVLVLAAPFIENNEIEDSFTAEARSWFVTLGQYDWSQSLKSSATTINSNISVIQIHQGKPKGRWIPVTLLATGIGGRIVFSETVMMSVGKEIVVRYTREE